MMIQDALETSLSKLATMDWRWNAIVSTKRKFSRPEIETHECKFLKLPILEDSLLVPGVYMSFDEFKNNNPSIKDFEVTKDKLNDIITTKETNGRSMPLSFAWGYCDSTHQLFVRSNHNYFKLQRRQNAFYIYGSNQVSHTISKDPASLPTVFSGNPKAMPVGNYISEKFKLMLRPFQLEWDSGKLY
jgi:hypothetical protein